jgi:hypothetical protein
MWNLNMKVLKVGSLQMLIWGEKKKRWDKEILHLLYDQDRVKKEHSTCTNRSDGRHHQNLMPRHLLNNEGNLLIFSFYDRVQFKPVPSAQTMAQSYTI